ncbi:MAG: hypothetical protein LBS67_02540, partial [Clostridiales Family XIII bacterium]|nr:hypothetical protein [Clostridiales Family XIII bacterium]
SEDGSRVLMYEICRYGRSADSWKWTYHVGQDKRDIGLEEDADAFAAFDLCLKGLSDRSRMS